MKRKLKYVNAGLFFLSLAFLFMNIVELAIWKFSGFDFLKLGFSGRTEDDWLQYVLYYAQEYFRDLSILLVIVIATALLGVIFSCILSGQAVYILSILASFVDLLCVIFLYVALLTNISNIEDVLSFIGAGSYIGIKHLTVIMWAFMYLIIMCVSVVGLFARDKVKAPVKGDIYPEQFYGRKNGLQRPPVYQPPLQQPPVQQPPVQQPPVEKPVCQPEKRYDGFHGAIVGKNPIYAGKALLLAEATKVFFVEDDGNIVTSRYEDEQAVAEIYFADGYQEYCVKPMEKKCIYLESGQPLGAGRIYYLPRGTEVYVKDKKNLFELA